MRRILLVLSVAVIMAVMMVASALPAFAAPKNTTAPNCDDGNDQAFNSGQQKEQRQGSLNKNYFGDGKNPNAAHCLELI